MKRNEADNSKILLMVIIAFEILYWGVAIITDGKIIDNYFVTDYTNTAMDYFNSLAAVDYQDPYQMGWISQYPALCYVVLGIVYRLIPTDYRVADGFALRSNMMGQLGYFILLLTGVLLMVTLLDVCIKENKNLVRVALFLSGASLFILERGNLLFLCTPLLIAYCIFYNDQDYRKRVIGYLALAISAGFKPHFAVFGMLTLKEKKWKEILLLMIMGGLFVIGPFYLFNGVSSIELMLSHISEVEEIYLGCKGLAKNYSFVNIVRIIYCLSGKDYLLMNINLARVVGIILSFVVFITSKKEWTKLYALSLMYIWIPVLSFTYSLIVFIIPFLAYIREEANEYKVLGRIIAVLWVLIIAPLPFGSIAVLENSDIPDAANPLNLQTIIVNVAIIMMSGLVFVLNILEMSSSKRKHKFDTNVLNG